MLNADTGRIKNSLICAKSFACLLAFSCFFLFFNLGGRTIENNDYPHFAEIGREILETGDWVIMHSGGDIYVDKPPLHTILIALSYKLFGVNAFAARFPSALFGLLVVLATFFFSMRMCDRESMKTGFSAAMLLLSSYGFFILTRRFRNDIVYSTFFSLTLFLFYEGYAAKSSRRKALCYSTGWLSMGLAALVKGPAALLPIGIMLAFLLVQRGWRQARMKLFFLSGMTFVATVLPYLVALVAHKDFDTFIYLLQHKTIMRRHAGMLYYIPVFFAKFFPGSLLAVIAAPFVWKNRSELRSDPRKLFLLLWIGMYLFLIHCIPAKVFRYLLPAFAPLAILTAWGADQTLSRIYDVIVTWWKIPASVLCLGFPFVIWLKAGFSLAPLMVSCAGLVMLGVAASSMKNGTAFMCALCVCSLLFVDLLQTARNERVSDVQRLYTMLHERNIKPDEVLIYKTTGRLGHLLAFYYNRLLKPEINDNLQVQARVKAVVTDADNTHEVIDVFGAAAESSELKNHKGSEGGADHVVLFYTAPPHAQQE
ncbi:MAG: glycosyltransferase family 39 protein [Desulfobacterota bacterium]|nr:glycosyltransferase family 39 protein [Thermodesulfobacteriota bacterium]